MIAGKLKIGFNPKVFSAKILLTVSVFILAFIFFWSIYIPLYSPDCYFHLSVGRWVFRNHAIPTTNTFTFITPGKEWISNEWLSGLIFYLVYSNWRETGILALRSFVGVLTMFFIFKSLGVLKVDYFLKILGTLATGVIISNRFFDRPEIFSFLLFSLLIYLLISYTKTQKFWYLLPLPVIFLAWPNIQGYSPIGLIVFSYYLGRKILAITKDPKQIFRSFLDQKIFIASFVLSILAATFTIGQFKRFFYAFFLNKELFGVVAEVQSLFKIVSGIKYDFWLYISLDLIIFTIVILLGLQILSFKFSKKTLPVNLWDLGYFIFIVGLAFKFIRMVPTANLLSTPLIIQAANSFFPKEKKNTILFYLTLAPITILVMIMVVSIFQKNLYAHKANTLFIAGIAGDPMIAANTTWKESEPFAALDFIKKHYTPQKILTSINWSNVVYWELDEKTKVFADIIYEKQTKESLADYLIMAIGQKDWQEKLKKYNPDLIITTQPLNLVEVFAMPAWESPNYKRVYVDEATIVYAKNELITDKSQILTALQPELNTDLKFKEENTQKAQEEIEKLLSYNPKNSFALEQKISLLLFKKDFEKAAEVSENAINLVPTNPNFYLYLGMAKAEIGKCNEIALPLSKAKRLAGGYNYLKKSADTVAAKCFLKI